MALMAIVLSAALGWSGTAQPGDTSKQLHQRLIRSPLATRLIPANARGTIDTPLHNPFWQHMLGDPIVLPCTHLVAEHAQGDPLIGPCMHMKLQHPGGHPTGAIVPCTHVKNWATGEVEHPNGHEVIAACPHWVPEHAEGHPTGAMVPCVHLRLEHPSGHPGDYGPCLHAMPLVSSDAARGINFYTNDQNVREAVIETADRFKDWGLTAGGEPFMIYTDASGSRVVSGTPRPLSVFNRPWVDPANAGNTDPMWSHYFSGLHYLQITDGVHDTAREVVYHEMGHAITGNACVAVLTPGGPHTLDTATDGGLGVSEGWANFIRLAMLHSPKSETVPYADSDWELGDRPTAPRDARNEYRVACILWDLYDTHNEAGDTLSLPVSELFRVFNPTMETFTLGIIIRDLADYIERLKANNPQHSAAIDAIVTLNIGAPVQRTPILDTNKLPRPRPGR